MRCFSRGALYKRDRTIYGHIIHNSGTCNDCWRGAESAMRTLPDGGVAVLTRILLQFRGLSSSLRLRWQWRHPDLANDRPFVGGRGEAIEGFPATIRTELLFRNSEKTTILCEDAYRTRHIPSGSSKRFPKLPSGLADAQSRRD